MTMSPLKVRRVPGVRRDLNPLPGDNISKTGRYIHFLYSIPLLNRTISHSHAHLGVIYREDVNDGDEGCRVKSHDDFEV
jgi:hypothetical protein